MKKESEMSLNDRIKLHMDSKDLIMIHFLKEIVSLDYSNEGIGKAAAFLYDIIN